MSEPDWESLVVVASVVRTHGLRGEVVLFPLTDFPEDRFQPGSRLLMQEGSGTRALTVRSARFHKGRPIVGFDAIESIDDAEPLAGRELRIEAADLVELPPGAYYHHDLVGCRVETDAGVEVGTVTRVEGAGVATRLVVGGGAAEEQLVPLVDAICRLIDTGARRIVIAAPEGLIGLNAVSGKKRVWRGGRGRPR